jgi:ketosteroid isomerase-like protein
MADDNLALIQSAYEAFGRGDVPAVLGIMSEDIEWSVPEVVPHGMKVRGRDEVGGFFERLGATWSDFGLDIDDFVASGDRVCVIGRASGTYDGKQTGYGWVHSWTVRDGAAVRFDEYVDPAPELYR